MFSSTSLGKVKGHSLNTTTLLFIDTYKSGKTSPKHVHLKFKGVYAYKCYLV